ncbi:hypothetical protein AGLY_010207, partial [Aphis glycines]
VRFCSLSLEYAPLHAGPTVARPTPAGTAEHPPPPQQQQSFALVTHKIQYHDYSLCSQKKSNRKRDKNIEDVKEEKTAIKRRKIERVPFFKFLSPDVEHRGFSFFPLPTFFIFFSAAAETLTTTVYCCRTPTDVFVPNPSIPLSCTIEYRVVHLAVDTDDTDVHRLRGIEITRERGAIVVKSNCSTVVPLMWGRRSR